MNIFTRIEQALNAIREGWTSLAQAETMAAVIMAIRPETSVEIGVYAGKGLISMGLAHREIGKGKAIGIDPYSSSASAEGQSHPKDADFWMRLDHEPIYKMALGNIERFGLNAFCDILRLRSDAVAPIKCGLLRIDGNHGPQAIRDFERFTPGLEVGGFLFVDDENWTGGNVATAVAKLRASGKYREICSIEQSRVFQKIAL